MPDVVLAKMQTIERCLGRIEEEYNVDKAAFRSNFTRQDSVILNLERASQATIDIATHIVKVKRLGIPNSSRELFTLLEEADIITASVAREMQNMVGFRNIAVHDYQNLNIDIVIAIVEKHLDDFQRFKAQIVERFLKQQ